MKWGVSVGHPGVGLGTAKEKLASKVEKTPIVGDKSRLEESIESGMKLELAEENKFNELSGLGKAFVVGRNEDARDGWSRKGGPGGVGNWLGDGFTLSDKVDRVVRTTAESDEWGRMEYGRTGLLAEWKELFAANGGNGVEVGRDCIVAVLVMLRVGQYTSEVVVTVTDGITISLGFMFIVYETFRSVCEFTAMFKTASLAE